MQTFPEQETQSVAEDVIVLADDLAATADLEGFRAEMKQRDGAERLYLHQRRLACAHRLAGRIQQATQMESRASRLEGA
jgi:hypothetical protein